MDAIFFGSRIILHMEGRDLGTLLSKFLAGSTIFLLTVDFLEVYLVGPGLELPREPATTEKNEKKLKREGLDDEIIVHQKIKGGEEERPQIIKKKTTARVPSTQDGQNSSKQTKTRLESKLLSRPRLSNFRLKMGNARFKNHKSGKKRQTSRSEASGFLLSIQSPKKEN